VVYIIQLPAWGGGLAEEDSIVQFRKPTTSRIFASLFIKNF